MPFYFLPHAVLQVVELISGGAQIAVTNENKMHYLNLLAQYRLASQVREEVEHFLKGKETSTPLRCHFVLVHLIQALLLCACNAVSFPDQRQV